MKIGFGGLCWCYLIFRLAEEHQTSKRNGAGSFKKLFKDAKKIYVKGHNTGEFIKNLDIGKIMTAYCNQLKTLCRIAELNCKYVCKK